MKATKTVHAVTIGSSYHTDQIFNTLEAAKKFLSEKGYDSLFSSCDMGNYESFYYCKGKFDDVNYAIMTIHYKPQPKK